MEEGQKDSRVFLEEALKMNNTQSNTTRAKNMTKITRRETSSRHQGHSVLLFIFHSQMKHVGVAPNNLADMMELGRGREDGRGEQGWQTFRMRDVLMAADRSLPGRENSGLGCSATCANNNAQRLLWY